VQARYHYSGIVLEDGGVPRRFLVFEPPQRWTLSAENADCSTASWQLVVRDPVVCRLRTQWWSGGEAVSIFQQSASSALFPLRAPAEPRPDRAVVRFWLRAEPELSRRPDTGHSPLAQLTTRISMLPSSRPSAVALPLAFRWSPSYSSLETRWESPWRTPSPTSFAERSTS
jgi:hypothetical protein